MIERLQRRAEAAARARAERALAAIAGADLPEGVSAVRDGAEVKIAGRGLLRRIAFDPRLAATALLARDA